MNTLAQGQMLSTMLEEERAARSRAERERDEAALRASRLARVNLLSQELIAATSVAQALEITARALTQLFPGSARSVVTMFDEARARAEIYAVGTLADSIPRWGSVPVEGSLIEAVARRRETARVSLTPGETTPYEVLNKLAASGIREVIIAPLVSKDRVLGTLNIAARDPEDLAADDGARLTEIAATLAINLELIATIEQLGSALAGEREANRVLATSLRERAEAEARARDSARLVSQQHEQLLAMSTPVLPIGEQAFMMPVFGELNESRVRRLADIGLSAAASRGATSAIIDITGVDGVMDSVADALARVIAGFRLIGCRVVLTGVRPVLARRLVALGVSFGAVRVCATLRDAIRTVLLEPER